MYGPLFEIPTLAKHSIVWVGTLVLVVTSVYPNMAAACGGVTRVCTPQPPICSQDCFYVTKDFPTCRTVCTPQPPDCVDVVEPNCPAVYIDPNYEPPPPKNPNEPDIGACAFITPQEGYTCEVRNGKPILVRLGNDDAFRPQGVGACANVTPAEGFKCEEKGGRPVIVPIETASTNFEPGGIGPCAYVMPAEGYICEEEDGKAVMVPIEPKPDKPFDAGICRFISTDPSSECKSFNGVPIFVPKGEAFKGGAAENTCLTTGQAGVYFCDFGSFGNSN